MGSTIWSGSSAGSGSQLVAGKRTSRRIYGMELSEAFCDVVVDRWQAFTGKAGKLDCDGRSFDEIKAERQAEGKTSGVPGCCYG
jgi:hypothetical protein